MEQSSGTVELAIQLWILLYSQFKFVLFSQVQQFNLVSNDALCRSVHVDYP